MLAALATLHRKQRPGCKSRRTSYPIHWLGCETRQARGPASAAFYTECRRGTKRRDDKFAQSLNTGAFMGTRPTILPGAARLGPATGSCSLAGPGYCGREVWLDARARRPADARSAWSPRLRTWKCIFGRQAETALPAVGPKLVAKELLGRLCTGACRGPDVECSRPRVALPSS
jgi:hypothetical protein